MSSGRQLIIDYMVPSDDLLVAAGALVLLFFFTAFLWILGDGALWLFRRIRRRAK